MTSSTPEWSSTPEKRILRELRETNLGGLAPGTKTSEFGRVFETILIRELQMLAKERVNTELRFARGYVVEDYGSPESGEVSLEEGDSVETAGPRFDIVCYHGNVAYSSFEGFPVAVVPSSLSTGVIEAKRTVTPKRFGPDSNEHFNEQLRDQRDYLSDLGADVPLIAIGAHFFGDPKENRQKSLANHTAVLGDLNDQSSLSKMAQDGELATVVDLLSGKDISKPTDEKTKNLQNIAKNLDNED